MKTFTFLELVNANVKPWCEDKGGLTYLSWSAALTLVMQADPCFVWAVHQDYGTPLYPHEGGGGYVKVSVTYQGRLTTITHPVLNGHKVIKSPTPFDVNKAVFRGLVKAIAVSSGIGLKLWIGEEREIPTLKNALEAFDPQHFLAQVNKPGGMDQWTMAQVEEHLKSQKWPMPASLPPERRQKLIKHLRDTARFDEKPEDGEA